MDKSWISLPKWDKRYGVGMWSFVEYVKANANGNTIHYCPCTKCQCRSDFYRFTIDIIVEHLKRNGFWDKYTCWIYHGETSSAGQHPDTNPWVYAYEKAYPQSTDDIARVKESTQEVLTQLARGQWPETQDEDLPQVITQIDQSALTVGARIMGNAFPPRKSQHYCRGLGQQGEGLLKNIPGFSRRSTSSKSSQRQEQLQKQVEDQQRQILEQEERTRRQIQEQEERTRRNDDQMAQMSAWFQGVHAHFQAQGIPNFPPPPQF